MTADRVEAVLAAVCTVCGITRQELRRPSRAEPLPTARALAAHFLYRRAGLPPREILPLIAHPEVRRTAIYHYLGRRTLVEARTPFQSDLQRKVEAVERQLEEGI